MNSDIIGARPVSSRRALRLGCALLLVLAATGICHAETRQQCLDKLRPQSNFARQGADGAIAGGVLGFVFGLVACSPLIGVAPADGLLTYGFCVKAITSGGGLLGGATGTSVAEDSNARDRESCSKLPEY